MPRVTDKLTKEVKAILSNVVLESHEQAVMAQRMNLAIQLVRWKWGYSYDHDISSRDGRMLGDIRQQDQEWACTQALEVRVYDPMNPERGHGKGFAGQIAPVYDYGDFQRRDVEAMLDTAVKRASQDYYAQ